MASPSSPLTIIQKNYGSIDDHNNNNEREAEYGFNAQPQPQSGNISPPLSHASTRTASTTGAYREEEVTNKPKKFTWKRINMCLLVTCGIVTCFIVACFVVLLVEHFVPFPMKELPTQTINLRLPTNAIIEVDIMNGYGIDAHMADINVTCQSGIHRPIEVANDSSNKVDWTSTTLDSNGDNGQQKMSLLRYWTHEHPPTGNITVSGRFHLVWSWGNLTTPPSPIDCTHYTQYEQRLDNGTIDVSKLLASYNDGMFLIEFCADDEYTKGDEYYDIKEKRPDIDNMDRTTVNCNNAETENKLQLRNIRHNAKQYRLQYRRWTDHL